MSHPLAEKLVSSELIYDGRVVHLHVDTVELPNGNSSKREIVRHPGAVAIVPMDADKNIIMVTQYRHAAGRLLLEIPAGTLNPGEDPDLCAVRELQEEIGFKPGKLQKIGGIYLAPGYSTEYIHLYLATDLIESRLDLDEDEFIEVSRLPFPELVKRIQAGEIADAKTISAVMIVKNIVGL